MRALHHSQGNWFGKYLPYWHAKSYRRLLTHWLPMTSILFRIKRICSSQFKCNYIQNKDFSANFLFHFSNLHQHFNIFKQKMIVIAKVFPKIQTVKELVRPLSKKWHFRTPFYSQHVAGSQTVEKFAWEYLYQFLNYFWVNWFGKYLPYWYANS